MLEDFDGLPHPAWMPFLDVADEFGIVPQDDLILIMRVLDDARLVLAPLAAMGSVFIESGR